MIQMIAVSKTYGPIHALRDVSFAVGRGEIVGLLGPNGAGKTTIMKVLTGFTPPSSGSFQVAGLDGLRHRREIQTVVGYMPEHNPLYVDMTVRGFLRFVGAARSLNGRALTERIAAVVEECNLQKVTDRLIQHLSKGYRQRVGLAQSLIGDPQALILDEPTIGLDPGQMVEMRKKIRQMTGNRTVIVSSHILSEISQICDRIVIVNNGQILAHESTAALVSRLSEKVTLHLRVGGSTGNTERLLLALPGVGTVKPGASEGTFVLEADRDDNVLARISGTVVTAGLRLLEMRSVEMDLESLFLNVVSKQNEVSVE